MVPNPYTNWKTAESAPIWPCRGRPVLRITCWTQSEEGHGVRADVPGRSRSAGHPGVADQQRAIAGGEGSGAGRASPRPTPRRAAPVRRRPRRGRAPAGRPASTYQYTDIAVTFSSAASRRMENFAKPSASSSRTVTSVIRSRRARRPPPRAAAPREPCPPARHCARRTLGTVGCPHHAHASRDSNSRPTLTPMTRNPT